MIMMIMGERGLTGNSVCLLCMCIIYGFNWSDIKKQTINLLFFISTIFFYPLEVPDPMLPNGTKVAFCHALYYCV